MKLDRTEMIKIHDIAMDQMRNGFRYKQEGHEEHLARCWALALMAVAGIEIELPEYNKGFIEPLE